MTLLRSRDPAVLRLHGAFWAEVCKAVGKSYFVEDLIKGLGDGQPEWRTFCCSALETLGVRDAIPALVGLLQDDGQVDGTIPPTTVAVFAAAALASMGQSDGVGLLLEQEARVQALWREYHLGSAPSIYLKHFRQLSDQDFGDDLELWRQWFASNE